MSGSANDPARSIERTIPPQPYQILMYDHAFTPYYRTVEEARKYPGPSTPYLHNMLVHPPEEFAVQQRASGENVPKIGGLTYDEVMNLKKAEDLTDYQLRTRDANNFPSDPPKYLNDSQKTKWTSLLKELLDGEKPELDPFKKRLRGELGQLKKLGDMAGGSGPSGGEASGS